MNTWLTSGKMRNEGRVSDMVAVPGPFLKKWVFVTAVLALLVLSALRLFLMVKGSPVNSDNTLPIILYESLRKGVISGWFLAPDNYLVSDFPLYVASSLVFGPTASVIWGTAIALSSFSLLIIAIGINKTVGQIEALIFVVIFTTPFVLGKTARLILCTPFIHVMTIGFAIWLASMIITDFFSATALKWSKLIMFTVLASFVQLSDPLFFFIFAIPMGMVGIWCAISGKNRKHLLLVSVFIIVYVILLSALEKLIIEHPGNVFMPLNRGIVPYDLLWFHIKLLTASLLKLLGASFVGKEIGFVVSLDLLKLVALGCFLVYMLFKYRTVRLETPRQAFVAYTVIMSVIVVLGFIVSAYVVNMRAAHYLFPALIGIFIVVSTGLADLFRRHGKVFSAVLILSGLYTVISMGLIRPNVKPSPYAQLAAELRNRHIQYGYAGYWHASALTFASGGSVRIRAVLRNGHDRVQPYDWVSNRQWYRPESFAGQTCLILSPSLRTLSVSGLESHYGKPSQVFLAQGMEVLVWPYNISQRFLKDL